MTARVGRIPVKAVVAVAAIAALVLLLLYLQGTIGGQKVAPGTVPLRAGGAAQGKTLPVERRDVVDLIEWPGTVTSRSVADVAPTVMARVLAVNVRAGSMVKAGDVVAVLDDRDLQARVRQASAALAAAEAQAAQVDADQRRVRTLFQKQAATQQDLDAIDARAKATRAQVAQARDAVTEAKVVLGETTVRAPFDGVVAARLVDPGDMAAPGKPVVVIHDPASLRMEVHVSESCAGKITVGTEAPAHLEALSRDVTVRIEEIAPMADPQTRTFLVKAALPPQPDVRPGAFGNLRTPCGQHAALLVPLAAVKRTGQLESVSLVVDGMPQTRHVRTGKTYGDRIEVLSGVQEGDAVIVEP